MLATRHLLRLLLPLAAAWLCSGCSPLVRYTNDLVDSKAGRTWFVRAPAGIGGTFGFVVGIPVDIVASPVSWAVYRAQPKETRDVISVFLFPSFVLWKVGTLLGAPFDLIECGVWRCRTDRPISPEEREAIERAWDAKEYSEYPVKAIYPKPAPDAERADAGSPGS